MRNVKRQQGMILPFVALMLVALFGAAAYSIDSSSMYTGHNQLQSALDMSALTGAKVLNYKDSIIEAELAARNIFTNILAEDGNKILQNATIRVEFSDDLAAAFINNGNPRFVRVSTVQSAQITTGFAHSFGFSTPLPIASTAVAGPSARIPDPCNLGPITLCGDPTLTEDELWGYAGIGAVQLVESPGNQDGNIGPGNFDFLDAGSGFSTTSEALAGGETTCQNQIQNQVAPGFGGNLMMAAFNTRFGIYAGPFANTESEYPPDVLTTSPLSHEDYQDALSSSDLTSGEPGRRVMTIRVSDCTGGGGGANASITPLGNMCVFLNAPAFMVQNIVNYLAEPLEQCVVGEGRLQEGPVDGFNTSFKIILHDDPARIQS